jgi:DNA-binding MarR family transcriptional regulator
MVDKDCVERQAHAVDARQKLLALTARARRAMKAARQYHVQFEAALARRLGAGDARAARRVLEAIVAAAPAGQVQLRAV